MEEMGLKVSIDGRMKVAKETGQREAFEVEEVEEL